MNIQRGIEEKCGNLCRMQLLPDTETLTVGLSAEALKDSPEGDGMQRFTALAYTGSVVDRAYGKFVIDMSGIQMKDKIPMLVDHDGTKRAGYADKRMITDKGLEIEGSLSKSTEAGREVAALAKEGFPWELSVGIHVGRREEVEEGAECEVNGETLQGPVSVARECSLKEISFLYSGADAQTYAVALAAQRKEALVADAPVAPVADTREELKAFLAAFPGEEALAAVRFSEGKTLTEVKLEIAERDSEALKQLRDEHEALKAEKSALVEKLALLEKLEVEAGSPGIGFSGTPRQDGQQPGPVTNYHEAWDRSESLRAEFQNNKERFDRFCSREKPSLKELV